MMVHPSLTALNKLQIGKYIVPSLQRSIDAGSIRPKGRRKRRNRQTEDNRNTGGVAGGGITFQPGINIPTNVTEAITSSLQTPSIIAPIGAVGSVAKLGIAGLIGAVGGLLLGGGQRQSQDQQITPTVTPTQTTDVDATQRMLQDILNKITSQQTVSDIDLSGAGVGGGSYIASPITTTITSTYPTTYNYQNVYTISNQLTKTITHGSQSATQKGSDNTLLYIVAGLGGIFLLSRFMKRK